MLSNLKAEFVRKGIEPYKGVMSALGCAEKTARNRLNGVTPFTVPEAHKIMECYFKNDGFSIWYLFEDDKIA